MIDLLFDYYFQLFSGNYGVLDNFQFTFFGVEYYDMASYLALLCSIVSIIVIVVLCCLFIGKLVKGVAHLINR